MKNEIQEFLIDADNTALYKVVRADTGTLEDRFSMPVVDLNAIDNPDEPGLHRRVRAGLSALLFRTPVSVDMSWEMTTLSSFGSEYGDQWGDGSRGFYSRDYDLITDSYLNTPGSTWNNNPRAATLRMSHSRHVTSSNDVRPIGTGDYLPYNYAFGLFSDSQGVPSVIGKLVTWNEAGYSNCLEYQDDADPKLSDFRVHTQEAHAGFETLHTSLAQKIEAQNLIDITV